MPTTTPSPANLHNLGLHHVGIRAVDYDATLRFYVETLGFRVRLTYSVPAAGIRRCAFLDSGDGRTYLELFDREAGPAENPAGGVLLHLALRVADASATYERALAAGASPVMPPRQATYGEPPVTFRFALVKSPNGEIVEFFETDDL